MYGFASNRIPKRLEFVDEIVGGVVQNFIPAIDKGLQEARRRVFSPASRP